MTTLYLLLDPITTRFLARMGQIHGKEVHHKEGLSTEETRNTAGRAGLSPLAKQGNLAKGEPMNNSEKAPGSSQIRGDEQIGMTATLGPCGVCIRIVSRDDLDCQEDFVFDRDAGPGERFKEKS
jgi:hypothetical protein